MINKGVPVIDQLLKMFDFPHLEHLVKEIAQTNMLKSVLFIFKKIEKDHLFEHNFTAIRIDDKSSVETKNTHN